MMGDEYTFYNVLGLAPKSLTDGPVYIKNLFSLQVIDEQRATIELVPQTRNQASKLVLGSLLNITEYSNK